MSLRNLQRSQQRCSYCREIGHKINNCNNQELFNFMEIIKEEYYYCREISSNNNLILFQDYFNMNINNYNKNKLKAICVRFCGATLSSNNEIMYNYLKNYLENTYIYSNMISNNINIPRPMSPTSVDEIRVHSSPRTPTTPVIERGGRLVRERGISRYNNIIDNIDNIEEIEEIDNIPFLDPSQYHLHLTTERDLFQEFLNIRNVWDDCEEKKTIKSIMICVESYEELKEQTDCCICMNDEIKKIDIVTTKCNHEFCGDCIYKWLINNKNSCPTCRSDIDELTIKNIEIFNKIENKFGVKNNFENDFVEF